MFIFSVTDPYIHAVTVVLFALMGLCVGSFLNVVIYRVPLNMNLSTPPSHCPHCGYRLHWYDNIPVFSYVFLRGRCRNCREHIPFRYVAVELSNTLLWTLSALLFADNIGWMIVCALTASICICIFFVDMEHMIIPDCFQIALLFPAVASVFFDGTFAWYDHLIGAAVGFGVFWTVGALVSRQKGREALGGGDVKLAGVSGLLLGWQKMILMVLISSISASVALLIRNHRRHDEGEMAFGTFLGIATVLSVFGGDVLIHLYLNLILSV